MHELWVSEMLTRIFLLLLLIRYECVPSFGSLFVFNNPSARICNNDTFLTYKYIDQRAATGWYTSEHINSIKMYTLIIVIITLTVNTYMRTHTLYEDDHIMKIMVDQQSTYDDKFFLSWTKKNMNVIRYILESDECTKNIKSVLKVFAYFSPASSAHVYMIIIAMCYVVLRLSRVVSLFLWTSLWMSNKIQFDKNQQKIKKQWVE